MKGGKMILRKINVLSLAKVQAVFMAIFGLIMALLSGLVVTVFGDKLSAYYAAAGAGAPVFSWVSVILTPAIYAVIGFISGAILALLYNLVAKFVGGIKIEFGK
jgi:hypothetical protein